MWNATQHSYEEIRDIVVDILMKREAVSYDPTQWGHLTAGLAEVLARRGGAAQSPPTRFVQSNLHPYDAELARDVFWDLFRQGFITLGLNDSNPNWPFFRLSYFGQRTLQSQSPYHFHDTTSFIAMVKREVPDVLPTALRYLEEAVVAFYAGCLLASCVMLGVAAEAEFLRLVDVAVNGNLYGTKFVSVQNESFVRSKITKFQAALKPLVPTLQPKKLFEDLDTNLLSIQSVLRIARNDAGHPSTAAPPEREQVYVFLQLFVPYARQLMNLRSVLA